MIDIRSLLITNFYVGVNGVLMYVELRNKSISKVSKLDLKKFFEINNEGGNVTYKVLNFRTFQKLIGISLQVYKDNIYSIHNLIIFM